MQSFDYYKPGDLSEAFRLKREIGGARYIAGGTDLIVRLKEADGGGSPGALISLRSIPGLAGIGVDDGLARIGAMTPIRELLENPVIRDHFPALRQAAESFGGVQIRNVATLGGNLCNGSPAADCAPPLLVYDARLILAGPEGERELALCDWFQGPGKTALGSDEIVQAIVLDLPGDGVRSGYMRKSRVSMDLALVGVAVALEMDEDGATCRSLKAAAGSVAPTPLRLQAVEEMVQGRKLTSELLRRAVEQARESIAPITDLRAAAWYRKRIIGVYLGRLLARLGGMEVDR